MVTATRIATGMCAAIASAMFVAVSGQASSERMDVRVAVAPTPFQGGAHLHFNVTEVPEPEKADRVLPLDGAVLRVR